VHLALGELTVATETDEPCLLAALAGVSWPDAVVSDGEMAASVVLEARDERGLAEEAARLCAGASDALIVGEGLRAEAALTLLLSEEGPAYVIEGCGVATVSPDWSSIRIGLLPEVAATLAAWELIATVFQDLAAHHGYHALHASMAEREGRAVLFCGEKARGKSTSCLALGRAGWTVRCDDRCYVRPHPKPLTVWGPARDIRLRTDVREFWPEVGEVLEREGRWTTKGILPMASLVPQWGPGHSRPHVLFLPEVSGGEGHRVEPLSPATAMQELLSATGIAMVPAHAASHFAAVADLVESTTSYRLYLGRDMSALPAVVEELLR